MNTTEIFAAVRKHDADIRTHNLTLQVRGWERLPDWLQAEIQQHRYALICALGSDGCPVGTEDDIRQLEAWLADGTLAWAGRRGVVIVPGCWQYNERAIVLVAGLKLKWYGKGTTNETFLRHARLIVERVRAMLEEEDTPSITAE